MKRRDLIKAGVSAAALVSGALLLPTKRFLSTTAYATSAPPLTIPPLLENLDPTGDIAHFEMNVQTGLRTFLPGLSTETYGYNGDFLGPTIRVRDGQRFSAKIRNQLHEPTTLHWHGLHVPAQWDGGPRQPIAAGSDWNPNFTIDQQAATLWYHPHAMGLTGAQVYRGLAGLFIIEDEFSDRLELPKTYGVDDIPLIIQDRRFSQDGQFLYTQNMHDVINGVLGNQLLVNGQLTPGFQATTGLLRLRLLNGSNSSIYRISFSGGLAFKMIASDGGFLQQPVPLSTIILSAGERAEILLDLSSMAAETTQLVVEQYGGSRFEAMQIKKASQPNQSMPIPKTLRTVERLKPEDAVKTRSFVMETMSMGMTGERLTINGKKMDPKRIDERIKHNTVEIWEITNRASMMMSMPHSMHLHDVQFQILDRNGQPPEAHELGYKDTVLIPQGESVRIIIPFGDYRGIYMYHCHLLEHEDDGMMGQFEVF